MVQHIPSGVKQPTDTDEVIGPHSSISEVRDDCRESEFPLAESAIEVSCACTCDYDRVEVPSAGLSNKRTGADVDEGDKHWANQFHHTNVISHARTSPAVPESSLFAPLQ